MAVPARRSGRAFHQGDELVADIDEGGALPLAPQCEIEDAAIEGKRLLHIATSRATWLIPTSRGLRCVVSLLRSIFPCLRQPVATSHGASMGQRKVDRRINMHAGGVDAGQSRMIVGRVEQAHLVQP